MTTLGICSALTITALAYWLITQATARQRRLLLYSRDPDKRAKELLRWLKTVPDTPQEKHKLAVDVHTPWEQAIDIPSTHRDARNKLVECLGHNKPYALYLRGFSSETIVSPIVDGFNAIISPCDYTHEIAVYEAVSKHIPIVALENRADVMHSSPISQLELPHRLWEPIAAILIDNAALIVVSVNDVSPSILMELSRIKYFNAQHRTIIVIDPELKSNIRWAQFADNVISDPVKLTALVEGLLHDSCASGS